MTLFAMNSLRLPRVALLLLLLPPASDCAHAKAAQETGSEPGQQQDRLTAAEVQAGLASNSAIMRSK